MQALPVSTSLWHLNQPWWEFVLRGLLVYAFLLLLLRLTGKRQVGQLSPFDLVLLLILSNAVQNSMNAGDNSVAAGLILATTLVGLHALLNWLNLRSKRAAAVLQGKPELLVHNGKILTEAMDRVAISRHELMSALRKAGLTDVEQIHAMIMETNGEISVIPKKTNGSS